MTTSGHIQRAIWPVAVLVVSAAKRGAGLQNMVDRIEALGGMLEISSAIGAGTCVTGRVPVKASGGA